MLKCICCPNVKPCFRKGKYLSLAVGNDTNTKPFMVADIMMTHNINYIGFGQNVHRVYEYQILNKQGIPVLSGKTKDRFEEAGYKYFPNNYLRVFNGNEYFPLYFGSEFYCPKSKVKSKVLDFSYFIILCHYTNPPHP